MNIFVLPATYFTLSVH